MDSSSERGPRGFPGLNGQDSTVPGAQGVHLYQEQDSQIIHKHQELHLFQEHFQDQHHLD